MTYANKRRLVLVLSLLTLPLAWPARAAYRAFGSTSLFDLGTTMLCLIPGTIGSYLRTAFYTQTLTRCGYDFSLGFLSIVQHPHVEIGRGVYVGSLSLIGRDVAIDNDVLIGSRVIVKGDSVASTSPRRLRIGAETWVGESAIVTADVGAGCIVGAGCTQDQALPDGSVAAGNPMRLIARNALSRT